MKRAILLVDHGSRNDASNANLRCITRLVQYLVGDALRVFHAHMEQAQPSVAEGFERCVVEGGAEEVIVQPYLLAAGRHASEDIPRLAAEAAAQHRGVRFRVVAPLGVHPLLGQIVLDRCGLSATRHPEATDASCPLDPARCSQPWCGDRDT